MAPNEDTDDPARIQRKLAWRIGIAGLMVAVLLGGLTLFDYLAAGPDEPEHARFTDPVPVPRKSATQGPVVPVPDETEKPAEAVKPEAIPESTEAPALPPVPEEPAPGAMPAPGRAARHAPYAPRSTALPPVPGRIEQRDRLSASRPPSAATGLDAPASVPLASPASPLPVLPRLLSGYVLQAGVFTDSQRAEDVATRLRQEGIPATLETRVVVGPFKNRSEAESARLKMKTMGIDTLPAALQGRKK